MPAAVRSMTRTDRRAAFDCGARRKPLVGRPLVSRGAVGVYAERRCQAFGRVNALMPSADNVSPTPE
jgi:hypothetical protein